MQLNFHLCRFPRSVRWAAVCALVLFSGLTAASASAIRVPVMAQAPAIDGVIHPGEWAAASNFTGFLTNGMLQRRRVTGYVGATSTNIYLAMRSQTPDKGTLVTDQKVMDPDHAVWDDSLEIYLTPNPDAPERILYQFLVNSAGVGGYAVFRAGKKQENEVYHGGWKIANGVHDGVWDFECAIPISSLGGGAKDRRATDGEWQINFTRNWKNPWEWSSLAGGYADGGCRFVFTPNAPAVAFTTDTDPTLGHFTGTLTLTNPGPHTLPVKATLTVARLPLATLRQERTVTLEAGKAQTLSLTVPAEAAATRCTLRLQVTSPDGLTSYYERETNWSIAKAPNRWVAEPSAPLRLLSVSPSVQNASFGAHMQRTMSLLATSNNAQRRQVHILIYGQSITGGGWWVPFMKELQQRFPYADLKVENRSIGGIGTPILLRTAIFDVYPAYPDLIIFQAYGGDNGELEQLIVNMRRYTTADILLFTHHVMDTQGSPEDWEKSGLSRLQDNSADGIRYLAQKYNCELVELRDEWKQYLHEHKLHPRTLLSGDGVHPNVVGSDLMTVLVGRHFRFNPIIPDPWAERVRTYALVHPLDEGADDEISFTGKPWILSGNQDDGRIGLGTSPTSALKLTFTGNRVDILTIPLRERNVKLGTAKILIDGKPPSTDPHLYAYTRPDATPGSWFPAVLHLAHTAPLVAEEWSMRITDINENASRFSYEIAGSVTGPDGAGNNRERFVSNSGRIIIEPQDLERITWSHQNMARCPVGQVFRWKVIPQFVDTYTPPVAEDPSRTYAVTIAQGLANTTHSLEIIPNGDGAVPISAIQVYCPPMK